MKISYSIAILLSCTLAQLVSTTATGSTHQDLGAFAGQRLTDDDMEKRNVRLPSELGTFKPLFRDSDNRFTRGAVGKRNADNRFLATALRRRQANVSSPSTLKTPAAVISSPETQVRSLLKQITDAIKQALASDEGNDDQGEEETHDREDKMEKKNRKNVIKLVKNLVKAINDLLKEAGCEDQALDLDGVFKSAEKGMLAPPISTNPTIEARGLDALFKSTAFLDRNLQAAPTAPTAPAVDPENDGGDDGSTEGDDQHTEYHRNQPAPPAQPNQTSPGAPAAPAPPRKPKNSDGGTDGDDEHHQRHPNPAKKRSSDQPDPKEIKSAVNEVTNAMDELTGAGQSLEDENAPGLTQLATLVQKLVAIFDNI